MNRSGERSNDVEAGSGSTSSSSSTILESLASEQREASVLKRRVLSALVIYAGILGTSMAMTRNSGGLGAITTDTTTSNNQDKTETAALKNTALKADASDKLIETIKSDPFVYSGGKTTATEVHVVDGLSGPSKSPSTGLHKPTWKPTVVTTGKPIEMTGKPVENDVPIITITTNDVGTTTTTSASSLPLPIRSMPADFDGSGTKAGKARGGVAGGGAGAVNGLTGQGPRGGSGPASGGVVAVGAVYDTPLRPVGAPLDTATVTANSMDAQVTTNNQIAILTHPIPYLYSYPKSNPT